MPESGANMKNLVPLSSPATSVGLANTDVVEQDGAAKAQARRGTDFCFSSDGYTTKWSQGIKDWSLNPGFATFMVCGLGSQFFTCKMQSLTLPSL